MQLESVKKEKKIFKDNKLRAKNSFQITPWKAKWLSRHNRLGLPFWEDIFMYFQASCIFDYVWLAKLDQGLLYLEVRD